MRRFRFIGDPNEYDSFINKNCIYPHNQTHTICDTRTVLEWFERYPNDWKEVFENQSGWISVKDRLPEFNEQILVYCPLWGRYLAGYYRLLDTDFGEWKDFNDEIVIPPTHWMPLPNPPIDEKI